MGEECYLSQLCAKSFYKAKNAILLQKKKSAVIASFLFLYIYWRFICYSNKMNVSRYFQIACLHASLNVHSYSDVWGKIKSKTIAKIRAD